MTKDKNVSISKPVQSSHVVFCHVAHADGWMTMGVSVYGNHTRMQELNDVGVSVLSSMWDKPVYECRLSLKAQFTKIKGGLKYFSCFHCFNIHS